MGAQLRVGTETDSMGREDAPLFPCDIHPRWAWWEKISPQVHHLLVRGADREVLSMEEKAGGRQLLEFSYRLVLSMQVSWKHGQVTACWRVPAAASPFWVSRQAGGCCHSIPGRSTAAYCPLLWVLAGVWSLPLKLDTASASPFLFFSSSFTIFVVVFT